MTPEIVDFFWKHVSKGPDWVKNGPNCWIWQGGTTPTGYGRLRMTKGQRMYVHRLSWILHYGPIPVGKSVCHRCSNLNCVRPEHLALGDAHKGTRASKWTAPKPVVRGDFPAFLRRQAAKAAKRGPWRTGKPLTPIFHSGDRPWETRRRGKLTVD